MASHMLKEKQFLFFLLTTEPKQSYALLSTLTSSQALSLQEICFNLVNNTFPLTNKEIKQLTPYKAIITRISKSSVQQKKRFIKSKKLKVYKILKIIKERITSIIS